MRLVVTGDAGFIGNAACRSLLARGDEVIGVDNHSDYYDPALKEARLALSEKFPNYTHLRMDICDATAVSELFAKYEPQRVLHMAAQPGVRYSIENPYAYISSNIVGFAHILENCRRYQVEHLVYASSSSVYGANRKMPYSVHDGADHPLSLYGASKKSNELMAHSYSHLYQLPTTGLRFFTVYGPWGRPDMAPCIFARALVSGESIKLFNYGRHKRDFTYIDDVVDAVMKVLDRPAAANPEWCPEEPDPATSSAPWRIYNVGNQRPVALADFIGALAAEFGCSTEREMHPLQDGDVVDTYADIGDFAAQFEFQPATDIKQGVVRFVDWYRRYYQNQ